LSLIRDRWGVNIALKELYTKPVLAELASAIRRDVPATDLKLRFNLPACGAASLFLIPPVLGSSTIYGGLAATLAPSFRCIGLQYPGFEPGEALPNNLHEMATRFAEEILQEPIVEPVAVLGYSAGATLAFETVRLLEAAGLICRLILVDRSLCPSAEIRRYSHRHRRALLTAELKAWTGQDAAPELERIKGLAAVVQELTLSWKPMGNVNADILAIRASRGTQLMDDWTRMTSGHLTLFELDADHYGLIAHTDLSRLIREFLEAKL
jgi:thioesterase domain-containing protein